MQCCACGATAQDKTPGDFDGIRIDCPRCGLYEVSGAVLDRFLRLSLPERADALGTAKRSVGTGQIPYIDARCT
jgi:hypothetical protein